MTTKESTTATKAPISEYIYGFDSTSGSDSDINAFAESQRRRTHIITALSECCRNRQTGIISDKKLEEHLIFVDENMKVVKLFLTLQNDIFLKTAKSIPLKSAPEIQTEIFKVLKDCLTLLDMQCTDYYPLSIDILTSLNLISILVSTTFGAFSLDESPNTPQSQPDKFSIPQLTQLFSRINTKLEMNSKWASIEAIIEFLLLLTNVTLMTILSEVPSDRLDLVLQEANSIRLQNSFAGGERARGSRISEKPNPLDKSNPFPPLNSNTKLFVERVLRITARLLEIVEAWVLNFDSVKYNDDIDQDSSSNPDSPSSSITDDLLAQIPISMHHSLLILSLNLVCMNYSLNPQRTSPQLQSCLLRAVESLVHLNRRHSIKLAGWIRRDPSQGIDKSGGQPPPPEEVRTARRPMLVSSVPTLASITQTLAERLASALLTNKPDEQRSEGENSPEIEQGQHSLERLVNFIGNDTDALLMSIGFSLLHTRQTPLVLVGIQLLSETEWLWDTLGEQSFFALVAKQDDFLGHNEYEKFVRPLVVLLISKLTTASKTDAHLKDTLFVTFPSVHTEELAKRVLLEAIQHYQLSPLFTKEGQRQTLTMN
ncbi:hypothetical protein BLNAU_17088 [Blattamonas nauphoetae]|uniref:Uncharacterized protein n=1 Tax=Blattamonas nauphoetae TaxID=2049346 RepID=A0ABQ9XAS6_9EUKA|nr:hypothetical protein BLNAU_17088 [Blattamonas nauphoetae]